MPDAYCDVSLPVPLDQPFTYRLPLTLVHRVQPGARLMVPFGERHLVGVVLSTHADPPEQPAREALRLLDEEPALNQDLMALGRWIANYYNAPLGEVLRSMTPLAGELRRGKTYSLTPAGRDAARQLMLDGDDLDPTVALLRLLEARPRSAAYLAKKVPKVAPLLRSLEKKGFAEVEPVLDLRRHRKASTEPASPAPPEPRAAHLLNPRQQFAFDAIRTSLETSRFHTFLLHGVTGSGKTEVYLRSIEVALALGRGVLLLVPEIALTPAVAVEFYQRFGDRVAILHSAFNDTERANEWRRIHAGSAGVVVGTRSAVFAPVRNLGLIVVDEEHDSSYKQQETPRYNGRDVAIVRAQSAGASVVLGSATPALESRWNAERGKYTLLELPERIEQRPLARVTVVDMRDEFLATRKQATFSRLLLDELGARLANGEQSMLLMNRRGFSSFVVCRACGERIQCVNCSVTLTYHRSDRRLLCHYCNYAQRVPSKCPSCESEYIQFIGAGSERVEDELHAQFPNARIARLDRDTVHGKRDFERILSSFRAGEFDILVGTQMIAKGHDIPNVTLVGIVSADIGLALPDFRAAERTFQLLTQAAGRAGRGLTPGIVIIQTLAPEHYAIRFAAAQDFSAFYEKEVQFRRMMHYPPFAALANILVRSQKADEALRMAGELGRLLIPAPEGIYVLGPAAAPVPRIKSEFRYQMLLKSPTRKRLNEVLRELRAYAQRNKWNPATLSLDVDPVTLL
jgi:primosomal protein N' (replication factor Y)